MGSVPPTAPSVSAVLATIGWSWPTSLASWVTAHDTTTWRSFAAAWPLCEFRQNPDSVPATPKVDALTRKARISRQPP